MFTDRARRDSNRSSARDSVDYELERLRQELTTAIVLLMKDRDDPISKRELADRMKVTPGRVSQILAGDDNLTLRSLAAVSAALDARFRVELVPNKNASDAAVVTFAGNGDAAISEPEKVQLPPQDLRAAAYSGRLR